ncbi:MAG: galactokinase [Lachnospiraceae bacterium]|nr:galactokinase [Lachnospiraceae bacterium]
MEAKELLIQLNSEKADAFFEKMYGADGIAENKERYVHVIKGFEEHFKGSDMSLFSSAGRTEISGNHTDHNHGKVLAGSINLDCVAAAAANGTEKIHIISETYRQEFTIDINKLDPSEKKAGTIDLTKGMLKGFLEMGYKIGGFDAFITSNVISAAGVSSSAAYEMLICTMINTFFNAGSVDVVTYAHVGKYAENVYWDKASGLLDQMACAVGGMITIDFKEPLKPVVEKIDYEFGSRDHSLIIVQTGKGHADLSAEYSSIPGDMKKVAAVFGKEVCADITEEEVLDNIEKVRKEAGDRPLLRALHFFEENKRVEEEVAALKADRFDVFLQKITESGNSSWKWLQNCYVPGETEQGITAALSLTELFIQKKGCGACRVHGGGFAGVIMAMLPNEVVDEYIAYIEKAMGEGSAYRMSIRPYGAVCVDGFIS